jgi:hypothetical protein
VEYETVDRRTLLANYETLKQEMVSLGMEPVINDDLLEVFTDGELTALVKDCVMRIMRFRRLEGEL